MYQMFTFAVFKGLHGVEVSLKAAVECLCFFTHLTFNIRHHTLDLEEGNVEEVGLLRSDEEE